MAQLTTSRTASAAFSTRRERMEHSKGQGHFLDLVHFEYVPFLEVIEAAQLDAALVSLAHFAGVVLFSLERLQRVLADHAVLADQACPGVALHGARQNAASGDRAHATDLENSLNEHAAQFGF